MAGQQIPAGAVREVPVSFRSGIVDQTREFGEMTVYYRAPGGGVPAFKILRVEATVRADFEITPTFLDFGSVPVGRTVSREVSLLPRKMTDARITTAEIAGDSFQAEVDGRTVRVTCSPRPALRSGPVGNLLKVRTNSPNVPEIHVSVLARRVVPAEVTPLAVVVGPEARGVVTREVAVTAEKEFDIRRVDSDDPRVTAHQQSPGRGRARTLVVTVADTADGPVNATLWLTLRHSHDTARQEAYRVSVPVHRFQARSEGQ